MHATCVFGMSSACSVTSTYFIAWRHHHTVGAVTAEVREGAHRCRVVTEDDLGTVRSTGLVKLCPPRGRPHDLQSVSAQNRDRYTLWTTGHWKTQWLTDNVRHHNQEEKKIILIMTQKVPLTSCVVENLSVTTPACLVKCEHRHQVRVATLAVIGAVVAGCVAGLLAAVTSLDKGFIAISIWHLVPRQRAVSFWQLQESQRLWWAGVWTNRTAGSILAVLSESI